jgi:hypothetical protein
LIDTAVIEANIEHTRFPVPEEEQHAPTDDFPGLLRAADLIGQLADTNYLRKTAALFNEFRETGISIKLKFNSAANLRANYPQFSGKWCSLILLMPCATFESRKTRGPTMGCESLRECVLDGALGEGQFGTLSGYRPAQQAR